MELYLVGTLQLIVLYVNGRNTKQYYGISCRLTMSEVKFLTRSKLLLLKYM